MRSASMLHALLTKWLAAEKKKITDDARYHYAPAQVQINAPLALIQVEMTSRLQTLEDVERQLAKLASR